MMGCSYPIKKSYAKYATIKNIAILNNPPQGIPSTNMPQINAKTAAAKKINIGAPTIQGIQSLIYY